MRFEKYEGLGNDFLLVEEKLDPERAIALCDRHRGIGADGVLFVSDRSMRVTNADGSTPEMCGNGIRCVALHLWRAHQIGNEPVEIATDAGPHRVLVHGEAGRVDVWMRAPSLEPRDLPLVSDHRWIDEPIEVAGRLVRATAVSMGNPHVVLFDESSEREVLGPALERDPHFPARVNVGFATFGAEGALELRVWERGVGWTMACGTGACAAAVAAVETGRAARDRDLVVQLPGGELIVRVQTPGEPVRMTGPARHVFSGTIGD
jgi:diaminopimelate epimerase